MTDNNPKDRLREVMIIGAMGSKIEENTKDSLITFCSHVNAIIPDRINTEADKHALVLAALYFIKDSIEEKINKQAQNAPGVDLEKLKSQIMDGVVLDPAIILQELRDHDESAFNKAAEKTGIDPKEII